MLYLFSAAVIRPQRNELTTDITMLFNNKQRALNGGRTFGYCLRRCSILPHLVATWQQQNHF